MISPLPGAKYDWLAGTSMATPHVSGALAILLATGLSPTAAVNRLLTTADQSAACGTGCHGRLQIDAALAATPTPAPAVSTRLPLPPPDDGSGAVLARGLALVAAVLVVALVGVKRHKQTG